MKRILCLLLSLVILTVSMKIEICAVGFSVSAKAAVLIDAQTGCIIYSKNKDTRLPMASTTKIMTTLVTLESGDIDEEFVIDEQALLTEGSSMYLNQGDVVTKRELSYGMMLPSGNDAANAAALKIGGNYDDFAGIMNRYAYEIGMKNTSFVTPSGLHDENHFSTAYDMALLAQEAMKNDIFREICATSKMKLEDESWKYPRYLTNSNKLLNKYDGCIGIKTGFTDEAGRCLVSAAERNGIMLIAVTLNAPDDWNDHIKMLEYGFGVSEKVYLTDTVDKVKINVAGGESDTVEAVLSEQPWITAVNGKIPEITEKIFVDHFVYAPISEGDYLGCVKYYAGDKQVFKADLIAQDSCCYKNIKVKEPFRDKIINWLKGFFTD